MRVALLAGGTGGAKLARGIALSGEHELAVIANTADDVEVLGVHVSPDPDLITYWLSGEIDTERGWGIAGDGFTVFERLVELGAPGWFGLGDRDLATCLRRRELLEGGARLTEAQAEITGRLDVGEAQVLPMCDEPVRTRVRTADGPVGLQEFLVRQRAEPAVEGVELEGIEAARPTAEVRAAVAGAEAIVIGPSNPVISIGPILAVPGMRELLAGADAPVVAVSPFVAGRAIKGPTEKFMAAAGKPVSAAGVAELFGELLDAIVVDAGDPDPPPRGLPSLAIPTLMDSDEARREVAAQVLAFAREPAERATA